MGNLQTYKAALLIVDDNPATIKTLTEMLVMHGYNVYSARDGNTAIQMARHTRPDLILLDIMIPTPTGYEVCVQLKSETLTQDIPIIFLSALEEVVEKKRAFALGGVDYITKPFQFTEIISRIETHLTISQLQNELRQQNILLRKQLKQKKNTEAELRERKYRYKVLSESVSDFVYTATVNPEGTITVEWIGGAFKQITGYETTDFVGVPDAWRKLCVEQSPKMHNLMVQLSQKEILEHYQTKHPIMTQQQETRWLELNFRLIWSEEENRVTYLLGAASNITTAIEREKWLHLMESVVINARDAILVTDTVVTAEGGPHIVYVNQAFTEMTGYRYDEVIGQNPQILQGPNTDHGTSKRIGEALRKQRSIRAELINYQKNNTEFWVELYISPIFNETGQLTHWISIQRDITHRKRVENALRKINYNLGQHIDQLSQLNYLAQTIAMLTDLHAILETVARQMTQLFRALGTSISLLQKDRNTLKLMVNYNRKNNDFDIIDLTFPIQKVQSVAQIIATQKCVIISREGEEQLPTDFYTQITDIDIAWTLFVPLLAMGEVIGIITVFTDNDKYKFSAHDMTLAETAAGQIAGTVTTARMLEEAQRQRRIAETLRNVAMVLNSTLEPDIILNKILELLGQVIQYDGVGIFLQDGNDLVLWGGHLMSADYVGRRIPISDKNPVAFSFTQKRTLIIDDLQADSQWKWEIWTKGQRIHSWMSVPLSAGDQTVGVLTVDKFAPNAFDELDAQVLKSFANQAAIAIRNARLFEEVQQARMATEKANKLLHNLATMDGLTQIANRRSFDEYLHKHWQQAIIEQYPISFILADIDHFKLYNDTYGHLQGDECLQQVARLINQAVDLKDNLVARYGGEEFAVILPYATLSQCLRIAWLIRQKVKKAHIKHKAVAKTNHITLSIGVSSMVPQPEQKAEELIDLTDQALYAAKLGGRNQIISNPPQQ